VCAHWGLEVFSRGGDGNGTGIQYQPGGLLGVCWGSLAGTNFQHDVMHDLSMPVLMGSMASVVGSATRCSVSLQLLSQKLSAVWWQGMQHIVRRCMLDTLVLLLATAASHGRAC
jgi:hypothetical protein